MSTQQKAADDLEAVAAEVAGFIARCPEEIWNSLASRDGRTVASLAYHCAAGNDVALGWICQLLSGRPVHETGDMHNAFNDSEAERTTGRSKAEVTAMLSRTTERTAHFLRSLTDEELQRGARHGIAGRDLTVGQFIGNFGRHMTGHLESMQAALD